LCLTKEHSSKNFCCACRIPGLRKRLLSWTTDLQMEPGSFCGTCRSENQTAIRWQKLGKHERDFDSTECDFYSRTRIEVKAPHCAVVSQKRPATFIWCRTPTWNTTPETTPNFWNRFSTAARTWCMARDFWAARSGYI